MSSKKSLKVPLIGVIHLPALPGAPLKFDQGRGSRSRKMLSPYEILNAAGDRALKEAKMFEGAGFDGVIIENFGDVPFFSNQVPCETISALSIISTAVRDYVSIEVGLNVLRNDAMSALKIAAIAGLDFIRVNILSGVYATDQGLISSQAAELIRTKSTFGAEDIKIYADVLVKHALPLSTSKLHLAAEEVVLRSGAQGFIISAETTGREVEMQRVSEASKTARSLKVPFFVGSGASESQLVDLKKYGAGVIVSSCLREGQKAGAPLVARQVKHFAKIFRQK